MIDGLTQGHIYTRRHDFLGNTCFDLSFLVVYYFI